MIQLNLSVKCDCGYTTVLSGDARLFLWLAFGSQELLLGQVVGKAYMVALALPLVWVIRRRQAVTWHARYCTAAIGRECICGGVPCP